MLTGTEIDFSWPVTASVEMIFLDIERETEYYRKGFFELEQDTSPLLR